MSRDFTQAERLKFLILQDGIDISPAALDYIRTANENRALTPADYASTSGVILELEDAVWVNAPIATYNANFVESPQHRLELEIDHLVITSKELHSNVRFWLPPLYHDGHNSDGVPYTEFAFTHADRVRISPIEGCAFACRFCNLPFEFRYRTKRIEDLVDAVRVALTDPVQPASHVLISGGAPRLGDFAYLQEAYVRILEEFPDTPIDIMMVPMEGLLDVENFAELGVNELSINLEVFDPGIARQLMRRKYDQGREHYLDFLARAAEILGPGRVRSMLMVGLEPAEQSLAGVRAIAERGCVPVLSPFRPDPATPLRNESPPTASFMEDVYLRAHDITREADVPLGPSCIPCGHNTLTFANDGAGDAHRHYGHPKMV